MAELGQTNDPTELVHGDPAAITADLHDLTDAMGVVDRVGPELAGINPASWVGGAADSFRGAFGAEPSKWDDTSDAMGRAGGAIADYADALVWSQARAQRAIEVWAQSEVASALGAHLFDLHPLFDDVGRVAGFDDPGQPGRQEAERILNDARKQKRAAGDDASHRLELWSWEREWPRPKVRGDKPSDGMLTGVVGDTLRAFGLKLPTQTASVAADASVLAGQEHGSFRDGAISGSGQDLGSLLSAEAQASGTSGALGWSGKASAEADMAKGSASGKLNLGRHASVSGKVSGELCAHAGAGGAFGAGGGRGQVDAFAGAKVGAQGRADAGGVSAGARAEGWAGVGFKASGQFGMGNDGKFHLGFSLGAALGVGGSVKVDIAIDPAKVVDTVKSVAGDIASGIHNALHSHYFDRALGDIPPIVPPAN